MRNIIGNEGVLNYEFGVINDINYDINLYNA